MNTNEFYKQLMSEYTFDHEKIKKAAMGQKTDAPKKRLRIAITACSATAAAIIAVVGISAAFGGGNPVTVTPSTSVSEQQRFEQAEQTYEKTESENTEEEYFYVTFKESETPTDMQDIFLSVDGTGKIKVLTVYLDDKSAITGSSNIQALFDYDVENIDAVKIMCPANLFRQILDNEYVYLVEQGDAFPEDEFTVPDTDFEYDWNYNPGPVVGDSRGVIYE
ncbi:MAG: hypothetical protein J1E39_02360 [Eubacterium sp.]|nr:hypothetical protein [Eubacterium sp.]